MKHKFSIALAADSNELLITEYSETDKGTYTHTCDAKYDLETIGAAISVDVNSVISELRTDNFFPVNEFITKIAESVIDLYKSKSDQSVELFFNDLDQLAKIVEEEETPEPEEEAEEAEIDDLLEDGDVTTTDSVEKRKKNKKSAVDATEDDTPDIEEEEEEQ